MSQNISFLRARLFSAALTFALAVACAHGAAFETTDSAAQKQAKLIALLKSDAPAGDKAVACKHLAIYGTKEAVPVLAPLLSNPDLSSWARIALEAIPGPEADAALREAMSRVTGRLQVGVINSIGVRRDNRAVSGLVKELKNQDPQIVSAAAIALGRIGGSTAGKALNKALSTAPQAAQADVAEGCIRCAEGFLAGKKTSDAVKLYDNVRKAKVPTQKVLEATRGAILARGSEGVPLLLEQLRSKDKQFVSIGLRTARELPGRKATEALVAELDCCAPERQSFLLLAIADRQDDTALPALVKSVKQGPKPLRLTAVGILDNAAEPSYTPVLLEAAADADTDIAQAALAALTRMPGDVVDVTVRGRLPNSSGKMRQALMELAARRGNEGAVPALVTCMQDGDPGTRAAAVQAVGALGDEKQAASMAQILQKTSGESERAQLEKALLAIAGRKGKACTAAVLPLASSPDTGLRVIGVRALAATGGPEALDAVKKATTDSESSVQDEAVRALSTWPNNWPDDNGVAEPLLALAKSSPKASHQVLALRGYIAHLGVAKQLKDSEKLSALSELLPSVKRVEEKRSVIAALGNIPAAQSVELLKGFCSEEALAEDACSALVKLGKDKALPRENRREALQTVVQHTKDDARLKSARQALNQLRQEQAAR